MENKSKSNPWKAKSLQKVFWRDGEEWITLSVSQPHFLKNSFLFLSLPNFYSVKQSVKSLISKLSWMLGLFFSITSLIFLKLPFSASSVLSLFFHRFSFLSSYPSTPYAYQQKKKIAQQAKNYRTNLLRRGWGWREDGLLRNSYFNILGSTSPKWEHLHSQKVSSDFSLTAN